MRQLGVALLAFVLGLVVGWIAAAAIGLLYMDLFDVFDRDGGLSMGVVFGIGPIAGIVCGALAAWVTVIRMRRSRTLRTDRVAPASPPGPARIAAGTIIGALIGYFGGAAILWLLGPLAFESYYVALAVSYAPIGAAILFAFVGWWMTRRHRMPLVP